MARKQIQVALDAAVLKRLDELRGRVPRSALIAQLIEQAVDREGDHERLERLEQLVSGIQAAIAEIVRTRPNTSAVIDDDNERGE